jgi:hypothetical protein
LVTRTSADLQEKSKNELLRQIPIFNHHAANELEPLAIINRQSPAAAALHVRLPKAYDG